MKENLLDGSAVSVDLADAFEYSLSRTDSLSSDVKIHRSGQELSADIITSLGLCQPGDVCVPVCVCLFCICFGLVSVEQLSKL